MFMWKRITNWLLVLLLVWVGVCQGREEGAAKPIEPNAIPIIKYLWYGFDLIDIRPGIKGKVAVDLTATVQSKHIWHGIDVFDDHGVVLPAVGVTLGETGFSSKVIGSQCLSDGFSHSRALVYAAFYTGVLLKDTPYATHFTTNYTYYSKPKIADRKKDNQEVGLTLFWPKLITLGEGYLTPSYFLAYIWASRSDSSNSGCEGYIHVFGLGYDFDVANFWPSGEKQPFRLSGDITYNDGYAGSGIEHDWSHATLGISTDFKKGNLTVTPFLNYQISMEDSVNDENELWCGTRLTYRF